MEQTSITRPVVVRRHLRGAAPVGNKRLGLRGCGRHHRSSHRMAASSGRCSPVDFVTGFDVMPPRGPYRLRSASFREQWYALSSPAEKLPFGFIPTGRRKSLMPEIKIDFRKITT